MCHSTITFFFKLLHLFGQLYYTLTYSFSYMTHIQNTSYLYATYKSSRSLLKDSSIFLTHVHFLDVFTKTSVTKYL